MTGQFTVIQNRVFDDTRLKSIDFTILAVLQSMMGVNGYCFPSYNYIADKAHCSRRTAISSMHRLVLMGYVVKERGVVGDSNEQSSNRYYINNNPDAGRGANNAPINDKSGVQKLHSDVVQKLHPEQNKFFEKNARVCAHTRESEICTPKSEQQQSESGSLPDATPDKSKKSINCPYSSDEIRRLREFNSFCLSAFQKNVFDFAKIFKISNSGLIFIRFFNFVNGETKANLILQAKKTIDKYITIVDANTFFEQEMEFIDYDE